MMQTPAVRDSQRVQTAFENGAVGGTDVRSMSRVDRAAHGGWRSVGQPDLRG